MTTAIVDIETNGLKEAVIKNGQITIPKATKIYCIVAKCYDTGRMIQVDDPAAGEDDF